MAAFISPQHTRSRVNTAGRHVREGRLNLEDTLVIENWRASHAYVLNIFQHKLRQRSSGKNVAVVQRLKRRHTIFDKLKREPHMQLAYMHDIAGCRAIFNSIDEMEAFRDSLHTSRAKHQLRSKDRNQYNYVLRPKASGYRGIHDVYRFEVGSEAGKKWNGLLVEIQYRTPFQNAWATAVEVADLITTNRIKFGEATPPNLRFFRLASEIIARAHEDMRSSLPDMDNASLLAEFDEADGVTGLMETFTRLRVANVGPLLRQHVILIYNFAPQRGADALLEVETFSSQAAAIERYQVLEKEREGAADIVLVRAAEEAYIKTAYKNYFSDVADFLQYIREGRHYLHDLINA